VSSDDAAASTRYLQIVKEVRTDVVVVSPAHLGAGRGGTPGWYEERLRRRAPDLEVPDYEALRGTFGKGMGLALRAAAFLRANADRRPVYLAFRFSLDSFMPGHSVVPAGPLWKVVPSERKDDEPAAWRLPISPAELRPLYRRARIQRDEEIELQARLVPEPFEARLMALLVRTEKSLADWELDHGAAGQAAERMAALVAADADRRSDPEVLYLWGASLHASARSGEAEPLLREVLQHDPRPRDRAGAMVCLGEIERARGRVAEADTLFRTGVATMGVDKAFRARLKRRAGLD
jgi:hypothetical protein